MGERETNTRAVFVQHVNCSAREVHVGLCEPRERHHLSLRRASVREGCTEEVVCEQALGAGVRLHQEKQGMELGRNSMHSDRYIQSNIGLKSQYLPVLINKA